MSTESVMPSNNLIFCHPLLFLPSIFPSIRVFSNESALCIRWLKYWSFSFSISPSNEYSRMISFRIDWFDLFSVQGTLKSLLYLTVHFIFLKATIRIDTSYLFGTPYYIMQAPFGRSFSTLFISLSPESVQRPAHNRKTISVSWWLMWEIQEASPSWAWSGLNILRSRTGRLNNQGTEQEQVRRQAISCGSQGKRISQMKMVWNNFKKPSKQEVKTYSLIWQHWRLLVILANSIGVE